MPHMKVIISILIWKYMNKVECARATTCIAFINSSIYKTNMDRGKYDNRFNSVCPLLSQCHIYMYLLVFY